MFKCCLSILGRFQSCIFQKIPFFRFQYRITTEGTPTFQALRHVDSCYHKKNLRFVAPRIHQKINKQYIDVLFGTIILCIITILSGIEIEIKQFYPYAPASKL